MAPSSSSTRPAVTADAGPSLASSAARSPTPPASPSAKRTACGGRIQFKRRRSAEPVEEGERPHFRADLRRVLEDGYPLAPPPYPAPGVVDVPLGEVIALSNEIVASTTAAFRQLAAIRIAVDEEDAVRARFDTAHDAVVFEFDQYKTIAARRALAWRRYNLAVHGRLLTPAPPGDFEIVYDGRDVADDEVEALPIAEDGEAGEPVGTRESSVIEIFPN